MPPISLRKHVPLIKFLGPRKFLQHPASPSTATAHQTAPTSAPRRVGNAVAYDSLEQLPRRFQKKTFSPQELDAIDVSRN